MIYFQDEIVLRSPIFSVTDFIPDIEKIKNIQLLQTAIFFSNPGFQRLISNRSILSDKEELTLFKYYNRACYRPTPSGMFAGVTAVKWGSADCLIIQNADQLSTYIMPDQAITNQIFKDLKNQLATKGYLNFNRTNYQSHSQIRFVSTLNNEQKNSFSLNGIDQNELISALIKYLKTRELTPHSISNFLKRKFKLDTHACSSILELLLDTQLLESSFLPNIIGHDYLKKLIRDNVVKSPILAGLKQLPFYHTQQCKLPELTDFSTKLNATLCDNHITIDHSPFYGISSKKLMCGTVDVKIKKDLIKAVECLHKLAKNEDPPALTKFKNSFRKRFDRQCVPIMQALDPQSGVNYNDMGEDPHAHNLLEDLDFKTGYNSPLLWSGTHQLLLQKWTSNKFDPIYLSTDDISRLPASDKRSLPASFSLLFSKTAQDQIFIENAGGVSATALLSRFTVADEEMLRICKTIAEKELLNNSEVIFCDIGQLSGSQWDNVNRRENIYSWEIPINCSSTLPAKSQLELSDLVLSLVGEELILESVSLGKRIIPRHSSSYIYKNTELSVFNLLCDMQFQGIDSNLYPAVQHYFPGLKRYPRIEFERIIIAAAEWHLDSEDLIPLQQGDLNFQLSALISLRSKLQIPDHISIAEGDQQLVFDLTKTEERCWFIRCIKARTRVLLKEHFGTGNMVFTESGKLMAHQFAAIVHNDERIYRPVINRNVESVDVNRKFILGQQWFYIKVYCHPESVPAFLSDLKPLLAALAKDRKFRWFYIRYNDPENHLRIRFFIPESLLSGLIKSLKSIVLDQLNKNVIWDYQAAVYEREIERYGSENIEKVEKIFNASSNLILTFTVKPYFPTYIFAIASVKIYLDVFFPLMENRLAFCEHMFKVFYQEFAHDKSLKIALNNKYRKMKNTIEIAYQDHEFFKRHRMVSLCNSLRMALIRLRDMLNNEFSSIEVALIGDLIHMHLNRLFATDQKKQELVIYHFLIKTGRTSFKREKLV